eukprot:RCo043419
MPPPHTQSVAQSGMSGAGASSPAASGSTHHPVDAMSLPSASSYSTPTRRIREPRLPQWEKTFRTVQQRYKCHGLSPHSPHNEWFTQNQRELSEEFRVEQRTRRVKARSMSPDALVLFLKTSQQPSPQTRKQMAELCEAQRAGQPWSLAPKGNNSLEDPGAQMKELEAFRPRGRVTDVVGDMRTYKMGKYTERALIPWDFHREHTDEDGALPPVSPTATAGGR